MFVLLSLVGIGIWPAAAVAILAGFVLRAGAISRGWSLPPYRG
jgi:uncharacterized membrane protein YeiH